MGSPPLLLLWAADPKVVRALDSVAGEHGLAARRTDAADPAQTPAVVVVDLDAPGAFDALVEQFMSVEPYRSAQRVFVIGFSNGGFMAQRLACDVGDHIAGVISIAGAAPSPDSAGTAWPATSPT